MEKITYSDIVNIALWFCLFFGIEGCADQLAFPLGAPTPHFPMSRPSLEDIL